MGSTELYIYTYLGIVNCKTRLVYLLNKGSKIYEQCTTYFIKVTFGHVKEFMKL